MARRPYRQITTDAMNEIISEYNDLPGVRDGRIALLSQEDVRNVERLSKTLKVDFIRRRIERAARRGETDPNTGSDVVPGEGSGETPGGGGGGRG